MKYILSLLWILSVGSTTVQAGPTVSGDYKNFDEHDFSRVVLNEGDVFRSHVQKLTQCRSSQQQQSDQECYAEIVVHCPILRQVQRQQLCQSHGPCESYYLEPGKLSIIEGSDHKMVLVSCTAQVPAPQVQRLTVPATMDSSKLVIETISVGESFVYKANQTYTQQQQTYDSCLDMVFDSVGADAVVKCVDGPVDVEACPRRQGYDYAGYLVAKGRTSQIETSDGKLLMVSCK